MRGWPAWGWVRSSRTCCAASASSDRSLKLTSSSPNVLTCTTDRDQQGPQQVIHRSERPESRQRPRQRQRQHASGGGATDRQTDSGNATDDEADRSRGRGTAMSGCGALEAPGRWELRTSALGLRGQAGPRQGRQGTYEAVGSWELVPLEDRAQRLAEHLLQLRTGEVLPELLLRLQRLRRRHPSQRHAPTVPNTCFPETGRPVSGPPAVAPRWSLLLLVGSLVHALGDYLPY